MSYVKCAYWTALAWFYRVTTRRPTRHGMPGSHLAKVRRIGQSAYRGRHYRDDDSYPLASHVAVSDPGTYALVQALKAQLYI